MAGGSILALDLATVTGWAEGVPGAPTGTSGSFRLAPPGASAGERYDALFAWLWTRLSAFRPALIIYEAPAVPMHMRGATNIDTTAFLMGLPAIVEQVAHRKGVYRVRKANVQDVRAHFIGGRGFIYRGRPITGRRNLKSHEAKHCVIERCRELGLEPADDNEADAIALWNYAAAMADPARAAAEAVAGMEARP